MNFRAFLGMATALSLVTGAAQALELTDGKVKIGVLTDLSGTYSDLSGRGSVEAARMAVEDFGGQIGGMPIEVVSADHQNKADISSSIARKWYDAEQVDAIFDLVTSSVGLAVQEVGRESKKIVVNNAAGSTALTGKNCSPYGVHYTYDTYALAVGTGSAVVQQGGDSWFFVTADYAFGHDLENTTSTVVKQAGGEVKGAVRHPFPNSDFSSFLLQAQASGAKVIGLANAGSDTINAIKQAREFGIVQGGQSLAGLLLFISDIHSLGLDTAQGLLLTTGFYWDRTDESREWAQRFAQRMGGTMPTMAHAGVYSSVMHYLKAIEAAGTDNSDKVMEQMRATPINDFFAENGVIREDGRMVHDMYLAQVKTPEESQGPWDYYNILRTIPGEEAYRPLSEECPLVKKAS
ncbi:ABC transporter substrate-binding protein [Telmatospirillum sp. J64-1]|uniref:ABC transporter substrate-binding protein n=1 Tax=Telmatospirillum sp. J64-1 TaxID=2502183 RepID=UPI00115CC4C2|nr:ABC transporter substrate-binding protein [Telmatospirillum sp. J64-1]